MQGNGHEARPDQQAQFEREALPQAASLYRYASFLTRNPVLAEDLVQETLLKAWRSWHTYRPGSDIGAWLATILRHTLSRQRRKDQRELQSMKLHQAEQLFNRGAAQVEHPVVALLEDAIDAELMRAINALPRNLRPVVVLRDLKQLSVRGIAQVTGAPIGTVKSRLFRAHRMLRNRVRCHAAASGWLRGRGECHHAADGRGPSTTGPNAGSSPRRSAPVAGR